MSLASRRLKQDSFSAGSGMVGIETTQVAPGSTFELLTVGNMMFPPSRLGCNYSALFSHGCYQAGHSNHTINVFDPKGSRLNRALLEIGRPISKKITSRGPVFWGIWLHSYVQNTTHVCIFIAFVTSVGEIGRTLQNSVRHKDLNFIPSLLNKCVQLKKNTHVPNRQRSFGFQLVCQFNPGIISYILY